MDWNMGFQTFVKASPEDPPMMEVQVKVFSQIKKQFVWRRVSLWSKLGNTKPKKKVALADMGAMVCTAGLDMCWDLGLQKYVMEKTKIVNSGEEGQEISAHIGGGINSGYISRWQNSLSDNICH